MSENGILEVPLTHICGYIVGEHKILSETMKKPENEKALSQFKDKFNYYREQYGLSDYTLVGLMGMLRDVDFNHKAVLELGGWNIPREITLGDLGARSWVCVDMIDSVSGVYQKKRFPYLSNVQICDIKDSRDLITTDSLDHLVFDGDATQLPDWFNDRFDIVVSFATLEHVVDVPGFLQNVLKSLRPNGIFITRYGPLWSCYNGHHAWVAKDLNFNNVGPIGDWGHLLNTPSQMFDKLMQSGVTYDVASKAICQIYTSQRINRYFAEDYVNMFNRAGFAAVDYSAVWKKAPSPEIQHELARLHPQYSDFDSCALYFRCAK